MSSGKQVCDAENIQQQLTRILSCEDFDASDRNRRFLEYVVEEAIAGRAERIKAYSIATLVFGRGESFDPQNDAIVRIEAGRVRRALEHYYLTSGLDDPIRISIPRGSYVPVFRSKQTRPGMRNPEDEVLPRTPDTSHKPVHRPTIHVAEFVVDGDATGPADFGLSLTRSVISALTRFTDFTVVGSDCPNGHCETNDIAILRAERDVDFVLSSVVAVDEGFLAVEVLLRETSSGRYIWSDSFELGLTSAASVSTRKQIANRIADALGQPSGVIFSYLARSAWADDQDPFEDFQSIIHFNDYWRTLDRDQFEPVRQALERTVERDPHYAEAFACLSQLYSNSVRFGYQGIAHNIHPLGRAIALAQRAIHLSPGSSRAYLALAIAYWFDGQVDSAFDALHTSRKLNPNDMEVAAELGMRYAVSADWEKGIPLIDEAYRRCPALPGTYRMGFSMWHFVQGRFKEALFEARKIAMPGVLYPYIMIAASAHRLGRTREAEAALRSILALRPDYGSSIVADLERRNVHADIVSALVRALRDAGFALAPVATAETSAKKAILDGL